MSESRKHFVSTVRTSTITSLGPLPKLKSNKNTTLKQSNTLSSKRFPKLPVKVNEGQKNRKSELNHSSLLSDIKPPLTPKVGLGVAVRISKIYARIRGRRNSPVKLPTLNECNTSAMQELQ